MRAFSQLLDGLVYTRSRNGKLDLIAAYMRDAPDPDRGWALAALTGEVDIRTVKPALIRALIEERTDPVLFRMSRDYVGDTAETVALLWPCETTCFQKSKLHPAKNTPCKTTLNSIFKSLLKGY